MSGDLKGQGSYAGAKTRAPAEQGGPPNEAGTTSAPKGVAGKEGHHFETPGGFHGTNPGPH